VVVRDTNGKVVTTISEAIGVTTNNHSEYEAIRMGLVRAKELGAEEVCVRADSQLAVRQLTGVYRVKNPNIRKLFDGVKAIEAQFEKGVDYEHVRREFNADADALANAALDY